MVATKEGLTALHVYIQILSYNWLHVQYVCITHSHNTSMYVYTNACITAACNKICMNALYTHIPICICFVHTYIRMYMYAVDYEIFSMPSFLKLLLSRRLVCLCVCVCVCVCVYVRVHVHMCGRPVLPGGVISQDREPQL